MKASLSFAARAVAAAAITVFVAVDPALAGSPVPGPLLGVGAPALVVFGAGYYLIRRRRGC
jgi:hypothetical protein